MKSCRTNSTGCWREDNMERVNKICSHPVWKQQLEQLQEAEKNRIFCCHGIEHLLDVARIAYIENLEQGYGISKEIIYAASLLHDVGRFLQYSQGIPHEVAGAELAPRILEDCGFTEEEQQEILEVIREHRNKGQKTSRKLPGLIYRADKKSRNCGFCKACESCNWSQEKKNLTINI